MSRTTQGERFGRVSGHTLRRSPQAHHFTGQFVIMKKSRGPMEYDDINGQFQEVLSDGNLHATKDMVYSLNKQKRWELPGLLKESICNNRDTHEDLDFKVLLVERHLDSQGVFLPACTSLYESKTSRPERLPKKKYAHAWDLQRKDHSNTAQEEALRSRIHKLRCTKNRGGKKVNWRSLMDAMQERLREEEQRQYEEEENIPRLHYEVGYGRPENKYPWRPEMKMNTVTSKRSMGTKQRHKGTTMFYMEDAFDMEDGIQDDIYEEVGSHSEAESYPQEDAIESGLIIHENRPMPTLGEALYGLTKKPKQCKKRRRNKSDPATTPPAKKGLATNQATSNPVKVQHKGDAVYDPEGAIYKPVPRPHGRRRQRGKAAAVVQVPTSDVQLQEADITENSLPSVCLQLDRESIQPLRLETDLDRAYAEAECKPRKFAVQVGGDDADPACDPRNNVYVLFECLEDESTTVECSESENAQSWQVVKEGVRMRMTVYGQSDRVFISSENLATAFPSQNIVSIHEVMKYLHTELQKSSTSWNKSTPKSVCARSRHISSDIPTVRAALGWDCRFSTADEAYREITSRQTPQSSVACNVQATSACSDECGICYESLSVSARDEASAMSPSVDSLEVTGLSPCGHRFCNDCWRQYLRSGVSQGTTDITCPAYKCKTPVDPVTTMAFLSPAQFHAHYRRRRDATLARSARCHRCPNPLCGRVAQLEDGGGEAGIDDAAMMVRCKCGWLWCTECKEEGHWPASCQQAKEYRKQLRRKLGEKETPLITHVHVKYCPKCKTRWEKNGGCPSMICGTCRHNFCWLCLNSFDYHDWGECRKSTTSLEAVYLDYKTKSKDYMLELAVEHHKLRLWPSLKKGWNAATKLASRSAMAHVSGQRSEGFRSSLFMAMDITVATASTTNCQPLTWARTQEHLEMMSRRAEEGFEIATFCHECNFVLEHLAFLMGSLTRRQRRATWWRAMMKLRFIVQNLQQTLDNLPNIKWSESEVTMDRLCKLMHAGKECLRKLAQNMPSRVPQSRTTKQ